MIGDGHTQVTAAHRPRGKQSFAPPCPAPPTLIVCVVAQLCILSYAQIEWIEHGGRISLVSLGEPIYLRG